VPPGNYARCNMRHPELLVVPVKHWDISCYHDGDYTKLLIALILAYRLGTRMSQADVDATTVHHVY